MSRVVAQPALVWLTGFQFVIDIFGVEHFTGLGIDNQDLARPNAAFGDDCLRFVVIGAHL